MGLCGEHGWYDDSKTTFAGCPEAVHTYPPPKVRFSRHDEEACATCRALNEAKRAHYSTLAGPTIWLVAPAADANETGGA